MKYADRFCFAMRKVVGKRLTYAELTGKVETEAGPHKGTKEVQTS
jgi:hypothetical protein